MINFSKGNDEINKDIGQNIKKYRKLKELTLLELGEYIGVSESTMQRYESGKVRLSVDVLNAIAHKLDVSPGVLMGWDDKEQEDFRFYNNEMISNIVEDLRTNPEYRILLDAARDLNDNDLNFVTKMIDEMKKKDRQ